MGAYAYIELSLERVRKAQLYKLVRTFPRGANFLDAFIDWTFENG